jgi:AraC-like DNA-binding protein
VRKGIDWIVREHDIPFSLKELFRAVGYSRSYYTRLFRKETGVPPLVWLNRYRIEQAKRLLAHSDKSIAEIARAVGILDQNYFARLFRSLAGTPAREFRLVHGADTPFHS